jgi:hypothetical protein
MINILPIEKIDYTSYYCRIILCTVKDFMNYRLLSSSREIGTSHELIRCELYLGVVRSSVKPKSWAINSNLLVVLL